MTRAEDKDPGTTAGTGVPAFTPHDPAVAHVHTARIEVDASGPGTPLEPLWESIGYDEINWTYTATGRALLGEIGASSPRGYHVRPHYVFMSGTGFGLPHFGSGNVYHEDADGHPFHDFTIVDQTYDAIVGAGHHVLVELGFTPRDLLPERTHEEFTIIDSPTQYSAYEAGQWSYPPRDLDRWAGLVAALVAHCLERYGPAEVSTWLWELWNEPDIFYWRGTHREFCELYAATAHAVRGVIPDAKVGGPTVTGGPGGAGFLRDFLAHVVDAQLPIDFVSFHTKGSHFTPWRTYGPLGAPAPELQSPSSAKMLHEIRTLLRVMADFPQIAALPAIVDECDAGVPAHWGVYDNANFAFQNTEYFPVFQVALFKAILELNAQETATVTRATTWSFYFEGERPFEGTRSFLTAGRIEKPLLNGYRALGRLGTRRLPAVSDRAWPVAELDAVLPGALPEQVDALATTDDTGRIAMLVYRHLDDQHARDAREAAVQVVLTGLPAGAYRLEHHRIDADHSNAHTVWQALGAPQDPSDDQLAEIHARQGLEELAPATTVRVEDGRVELSLTLPLPAVSLLVLTP